MRHYWLISGLLLLAAPYGVTAADMPSAQSVEEPDSPDDDVMEPPQTAAPAEKAAEPEKPAPSAPSTPQETGDASYDKVVLQGLNKVTARAVTIEAPIGSVERFGTIEIVAHRCWKSAPEERPENAALLEISEIKQGEAPRRIFLGWMFSSSPGLSALEHPFYDVTVVACAKAEAPPPAAPVPPTQPAKAAKKPVKKRIIQKGALVGDPFAVVENSPNSLTVHYVHDARGDCADDERGVSFRTLSPRTAKLTRTGETAVFEQIKKTKENSVLFICTRRFMPENVTNELLYDVLKSVQVQVAIIREDVNYMKSRMTSQDRLLGQIQSAFGGVHGDFAELCGCMERFESRFDRVETRLNLYDPTH